MAGRSIGGGRTRRQFLAGAVAAGMTAGEAASAGQASVRKIRLGVVGCGGRGAWIADLFRQHGGYEMHAVADYFQDVADRCGDALGVDRGRRFSGLSGYRRLLESGVEAVALETPPFFFPEHAAAAVASGKHVYMAKPVAVDVPGCRRIEEAGRKATAAGLCFLVDYQMPTEPANVDVVRQVQAGAIGKTVLVSSYYLASPFADPPRSTTIEDRLQRLVWVNDVGIGGGYHVNACIHAIDAAMWIAGGRPVAAVGASTIGRPGAHGDSHDVFALTFELPDGKLLQHRGKHLPDQFGGGDFCGCSIHGQAGYASIAYNGFAQLVSQSNAVRQEVSNLYEMGARRNIAAFHANVLAGRADNGTVRRAVDSALATILGREAGRRRARLTMAQLLRENRRIGVDLRGLKA